MYARIARFEGGSPEVIDREVDRLRRDIEAARAGSCRHRDGQAEPA